MHVHTFLPSRENIGNPKIVGKLVIFCKHFCKTAWESCKNVM